MSQPLASAFAPLPFELVYSDGVPLDNEWHVLQLHLLLELIRQAMAEQDRRDFYTGGDMFVYYSVEQARDVARGRPYFRGPDIFFVDGVEDRLRNAWVAWEEGGRLPDVIVELLSPSTAKIDRTIKKDIYARYFRTREYYLFDPEGAVLEGFRLRGDSYRPAEPGEDGRIWSEPLRAFLGAWHGPIAGRETDWLRLYRPDGTLVPTAHERAETAEAELALLRKKLDDARVR